MLESRSGIELAKEVSKWPVITVRYTQDQSAEPLSEEKGQEGIPDEEQEPKALPAPTPASTPTPTNKPKRLSLDGIDLDMVLYYNENGESYYHTSDYCSAVDSKSRCLPIA